MECEKIQVLVVDDEESVRGTVATLLEEEGYEVTTAGSAEQALGRLGERAFALVITDIRMEGMTGIDLLQEVKRLFPATDVIIITSYASIESAVEALRCGAYDYLLKPFEDLELVASAVRRAVEKQRLVRERDCLLADLERKNAELLAINSTLAERANRDGLTGLYNHRHFQELLARDADLCKRHGRSLSLAFVDVDHFKQYNDTYGHPAGDKVLLEIVNRLQQALRQTDVLARYGGEEFVILLSDTKKRDAAVVASRLCGSIENHPFPGAQTQPGGRLTVSVGVASFPEDGLEPSSLIRSADEALYQAKQGGRNTFRLK